MPKLIIRMKSCVHINIHTHMHASCHIYRVYILNSMPMYQLISKIYPSSMYMYNIFLNIYTLLYLYLKQAQKLYHFDCFCQLQRHIICNFLHNLASNMHIPVNVVLELEQLPIIWLLSVFMHERK